MSITHGYELKVFNQLYREVDEIYHSIAVKMELSDSAFHIFRSEERRVGKECT